MVSLVSDGFPTVLPWFAFYFSDGFLMVCFGFVSSPMVSYGFLWYSYCIPMVFLLYYFSIPMVLWLLIIILCFSGSFLIVV